MDDKIKVTVARPVTVEKLTLHKEDWDKYKEHKQIIERGHYDEIVAYNKKMTK